MTDEITETAARPWAGRFSRQIAGRRYAVGDIHGCLQTFKCLVGALKLTEHDTLYLLGDYIDRGPDSKGVLDYLMHLYMDSDIIVHALMGNHEKMLLNAVNRGEEAWQLWFGNGGWATLQQFGVKKPTDIPQDYITFLSMLPKIHTTDDYVLVHAGLHFGLPDPINDTPDFFMLWDRDYTVAPELIGNRTLVVGHTKTDIHTIRNSLHTHHIKLDNGCFDKGHWGFGSLVALDLDSREITEVRNCEE